MTPENFCYWLQGIFEMQNAGLSEADKRYTLTDHQVKMVAQHLEYVFKPKQSPQPMPFTTTLSTELPDLTGKTFIC